MTKTEFSGTIRSGYLTSDSGQARAQSCLVHYTSIYHQQGYLHARPMLPKEVQAEEPNIGYNPQMVGNDAMLGLKLETCFGWPIQVTAGDVKANTFLN
jgi:hypothetical protein